MKVADSLFRLAKDLDVLRFRSSEKMNNLIRQLGSDFDYPIVDIDSAFCAYSNNGIIGNNLITDHLHPTLEGYKLIAKLYLEMMWKMKLLPSTPPLQYDETTLDSLVKENFRFSRLDSILAENRIITLKNDWPFQDKNQRKPITDLIKPKDEIEKIALELLNDELPWELAHRKVAGLYLARKNYDLFQYEMDVLISQYPIIVEYYDFTANEFLKIEQFDKAYNYLKQRYKIKPNAFSSKWLGIIDLSKNQTDSARKFLEESLQYDSSDAQVFYNLSGAYAYKKDYQRALESVNKCLELSPNYPRAKDLQNQLLSVVGKK